MDSRRVCEIIGRVAAEVLAEVRAGTWQPPATISINPHPHRFWTDDEGSWAGDEVTRAAELIRAVLPADAAV